MGADGRYPRLLGAHAFLGEDDLIGKFGHKPYLHPNAKLFNQARRDGLHGPELAISKEGEVRTPDLMEGSIRDVYGRR
jgi:hypothetical protein